MTALEKGFFICVLLVACVLAAWFAFHVTVRRPRQLVLAARENDAARVQELLREGRSPSGICGRNETALHFAAFHNNIEMTAMLLDAGAEVDARDDYGFTPLCHAPCIEVVRLLLDAGADANVSYNEGWTPLMAASKGGDAETVALLLASGADPDTHTTDDGDTALIIAARDGHVEVVKRLLVHGVSLGATNMFGKTAIETASSSGHEKVVALLRQAR